MFWWARSPVHLRDCSRRITAAHNVRATSMRQHRGHARANGERQEGSALPVMSGSLITSARMRKPANWSSCMMATNISSRLKGPKSRCLGEGRAAPNTVEAALLTSQRRVLCSRGRSRVVSAVNGHIRAATNRHRYDVRADMRLQEIDGKRSLGTWVWTQLGLSASGV